MIYVGIDVAKDKHDCYIKNAEGHVLAEVFTIANNQEGFDLLFQRIKSVSMFVLGMWTLLPILLRSVPKASITTSLFLMSLRSWFG